MEIWPSNYHQLQEIALKQETMPWSCECMRLTYHHETSKRTHVFDEIQQGAGHDEHALSGANIHRACTILYEQCMQVICLCFHSPVSLKDIMLELQCNTLSLAVDFNYCKTKHFFKHFALPNFCDQVTLAKVSCS